ncbi:MAG: class I adenylate-forming enzyme family protein, partial [Chloroflexota bacterium]
MTGFLPSPEDTSAPGPAPDTFQQLVARSAARFGPLPALAGEDGATVTYAALGACVDVVRGRLRAAGIGPRDRVVFPLPQSIDGAVLLVALQAAAVAVPVHPDATGGELGALLPRLGATAAILPPGAGGALPGAVARLGLPVLHSRVEGSGPAIRLAIDAGRPAAAPASDLDARRADLTLALQTSGPTGRPKLVPLTHGNQADFPWRSGCCLPVLPGDATVLAPPLLHALGQSVLCRSLAFGGLVVLPGGSPGALPVHQFGALVERHRPAWLPFTPLLLDQCLRYWSRQPNPGGGALRYLFVIGGFTPPHHREQAESLLGVPVLQGYGMSEAYAIAYQSPGAPRLPGATGVPVSPLRVVDDCGRDLPAGSPGHLLVSGPTVFPGYLDDPATTARAFTADGWLRTGDRGILLPGGQLSLLGRGDDLINHGGEKIDPLEVEAVLLAHPAVLECAVFALPHAAAGQQPAAVVVLRPGSHATARDLRRWALDRLASGKVPRRVLFADALPRTTTGKVRRASLPDLFAL